jgi:transcription elongation factor
MPFTIPVNTGSGMRKRKRRLQQLAPRPFDPVEIKHVHRSDALKQKGDDYYFQKKLFCKGMLIQTIQSTQSLHRILNPPLHEIKPFISAEFVTPAAALAIISDQVSASIRPGDHVDLIAGEQAGCWATVVSCNHRVAVVDLKSLSNEDVVDPPFLLEVPLRYIRPRFRIGDTVCDRGDAGEHAGLSGCVIVVNEDGKHLTFVEDQTKEHVGVLPHLESSKKADGNRSTLSSYLLKHMSPIITTANQLMLLPIPTRSVSADSLVDRFLWPVNSSKDMLDMCEPYAQASPTSS